MDIRLCANQKELKKTVSACVVFISSGGVKKSRLSRPLALVCESLIKENLFDPKKTSSLFIPLGGQDFGGRHLLLVSLDESQENKEEMARQAAARVYKALEVYKISSALVFTGVLKLFIKNLKTLAQVITEGFFLARYKFNDLQQKTKEEVLKTVFLEGLSQNKETKKGLEEGCKIADGVNTARWAADHPANLMTPSILARTAVKKGRGIKNLKISLWDKARLKKEKMGGILGVSRGSSEPPYLIMMEYRGGGSSVKPLCFAGKGLTFDSGGISLKPARNMDEMKFDMCGGAAVIGAVLAIARLGLKVNVLGMVGASENMPGASAVKPGDILRARNGKTMEVLNTDAEGRLVLADVLSLASELKPAFIVDAATLTGAVVVALGNIYTGLFTRNKNLESKILKSARKAGERMWPLPLNDFHVKDIQSPIGDVANISSTGGAGSSTAAAFLEHFVDKKIPWAHLDIAGTAYNISNRLAYARPKTASGVMVRTFIELARQHSR